MQQAQLILRVAVNPSPLSMFSVRGQLRALLTCSPCGAAGADADIDGNSAETGLKEGTAFSSLNIHIYALQFILKGE